MCRVMEAAKTDKPRRWEGESSGSEVDPEELLSEEQKGKRWILMEAAASILDCSLRA